MRVGNFSVLILEGREKDSGHIEMAHGSQYTLRLGNHHHSRRCDAEVTVDGKSVGCFRIGGGETIALERPAHDTGRFTFFKSDSPEAAAADVASVGRADRGLVQVRFRPEKQPPPDRHVQTEGGVLRGCVGKMDSDEKTSGGITGLTGSSGQRFHQVADLDYDQAGEVIVSVRLTCAAAVRPLTSAPRGNSVPAPVE